MKKYHFLFIILVWLFASCEDWTKTENIELQKPFEKTEEYYANLRAYKKSDHQIAFGWYGYWNPTQASTRSSLRTVPDSVDIISLWGGYNPFTEDKKADLEFVQNVLGTKVTFTIFAHDLPEQYEDSEEGIRQYARDVTARVHEHNFDGLDLDYEPGYAGYTFYFMDKARMEIFVRALGEGLGPKSTSGKLLVIDGVPYYLNPGLHEFFDYGIVQSYYSTGYTDLQNRYNNAFANGWPPEKYVFTEDFEKHWSDGGPEFTQRDDTKVRSSVGMAGFQPEVTKEDGTKALYRKGGSGTYHMEYDFGNDPDYKWLRKMIQVMNPAGTTPVPTGPVPVKEKK